MKYLNIILSITVLTLYSCDGQKNNQTNSNTFYCFESDSLSLKNVNSVKLFWLKKDKNEIDTVLSKVFHVNPRFSVIRSGELSPDTEYWGFIVHFPLANLDTFGDFDYILELPEIQKTISYTNIQIKETKSGQFNGPQLESMYVNNKFVNIGSKNRGQTPVLDTTIIL